MESFGNSEQLHSLYPFFSAPIFGNQSLCASHAGSVFVSSAGRITMFIQAKWLPQAAEYP